jgi:hypothetical protein
MSDSNLDAMLEIIKQDMPSYSSSTLSDESIDPYGVSMDKLAAIVLWLQRVKDAGYGRSWAKRGEMGVFHNVMRKKDRMDTLEKLAQAIMSGHASVGRSTRVAFVATLIDMANYCMMWASYVAKVRPEDFVAWLQDDFCIDVGIELDNVLEFLGWAPFDNEECNDDTCCDMS